MSIDGVFTEEELADAKQHRATIKKSKHIITIYFQNQNDYDSWMADQMQKHPERWTLAHKSD